MTLTLRRRTLNYQPLQGRDVWTYNGQVLYDQQFNAGLASSQLTWSEGHPWPKGRGSKDNGGPFETIKTHFDANFDISQKYSFGAPIGIRRWYDGHIAPSLTYFPAFDPEPTVANLQSFIPSLGDPTLGTMGATAISRSAPTNPVVDGSVALAELFREGLPSLMGAQLYKRGSGTGAAVGSEFLNYQFGILPILSDIRKTALAVQKTESIVKQLIADSGKNVRRRYDFPSTRDNALTLVSTNYMPWPGLTLYHWDNRGVPPSEHRLTERSVWFEGCFTFYIDPDSFKGLEGIANTARLVYGLTLDPSVVWNVLPWSWLVDWLVNVGDIMNNVSLFARDGLTLRYGYTMEHTKVRVTTSFNGLTPNGGTMPAAPTLFQYGERKIRRRQSPFSLGLVGGDFSLRQAAILTALGLTKTKR